VLNVIKAADIVVMSSHWEGLSLSNIEGMSAGKPFIASNVNGLKEVTEGWGLLFEHENAKQLADIILRLASNQEYYQQISDRCYQRAREFDINKMIDDYEQVYKDVLEKKI
jgi:glycosyltransferase involved in cell wall biosynthesis